MNIYINENIHDFILIYRASLLTGMYTHHIGRQKLSGPLDPDQPTGLALNRTLLPQYLKQAGYSTHMIGK